MTSLNEADRVARKVSAQIGRRPGLRGIAVEGNERAGFFVSVRIAEEAPLPEWLTDFIDGVRVRVVRRAKAHGL